MCFGPVASLAASGFLASVGTAIFKNIRSKKELLFAVFPLLFAIQQLIEGFLWLALKNGKSEALVDSLTLAYLTFAFSFWPILCPASVYMIEYDERRRKILRFFILLGALVSAHLLFCIIQKPVHASVVNCSIRYKTFVTGNRFAGIYIFATVLPYFLSSQKFILIFGIPNVIFCGVAYLIYDAAFISVWCFFAAVLSANLYFFLRKLHHEPLLPLLLTKIKINKIKTYPF